jgi:hypothetical protein
MDIFDMKKVLTSGTMWEDMGQWCGLGLDKR